MGLCDRGPSEIGREEVGKKERRYARWLPTVGKAEGTELLCGPVDEMMSPV